jgi:hypothetical protein
MKEFTLQIELWLPRPRDEIFPFFAEAGNLERIFRYRQQRMKEMFRSVTNHTVTASAATPRVSK